MIARRYAAALVDVVVERGEEHDVGAELSAWDAMIQSSVELQEMLRNPTVPYEQKRSVLSELIARSRVSRTTANFLEVLLRNQRLSELCEVNKKFRQILDERAGVVAASVTSARSVPEDARNALREKLVRLTGKDVRLTFATDEELIGGMVTRIGSTVYDGSVRNQLQEVEEKLAGDAHS